MAKLRDGRKPGWFWADNRIIDEYGARIGANGIAVYVCLARHASTSRTAFPSFTMLATKIGMHRRTVIRVVRILIELGLIEVSRQADKSGRYLANTYRLLDPPEPDLFERTKDVEAADNTMPSCPQSLGSDTGASDCGPLASDCGPLALKRTRTKEQDQEEQDTESTVSKREDKPQPPSTDFELSAHWLAQQWCFLLTRKRLGTPRDLPADVADEMAELLRLGVRAESIRAEIEDPTRHRGEHLWQFLERLKRNCRVNSHRAESIMDKLLRINSEMSESTNGH